MRKKNSIAISRPAKTCRSRACPGVLYTILTADTVSSGGISAWFVRRPHWQCWYILTVQIQIAHHTVIPFFNSFNINTNRITARLAISPIVQIIICKIFTTSTPSYVLVSALGFAGVAPVMN